MQSLLDEFDTCIEEIVGKLQMQAMRKDLSSDYTDFTEDLKRKFKTTHNVQRLQISIPFNIYNGLKITHFHLWNKISILLNIQKKYK